MSHGQFALSHKKRVLCLTRNPCQWGVVNGGCVVVGWPLPSYSFTSPILWFTKLLKHPPKKLPTDGILADEKSMLARWRAWLFIPSYESIYVGFQRFPEGCLSSQWSSLEATLWVPSKSYTNALIQPVEFHFGSVIKRGLRLMTSTLGSTFQKDEVRVQTIPLASSPS